MEKKLKDKHITINVNSDIKSMIDYIASYYQRNNTNMVYILLEKVIQEEFIKIQSIVQPSNQKQAIFIKGLENFN